MATRLFSKDPLPRGRMLLLWVGGLSVAGVAVIAATQMMDEGDAGLGRAERLEVRAERLAEGQPEFGPLPPPAVTDQAEAEEPSAEADLSSFELARAQLLLEWEAEGRRFDDSIAADRMERAQTERGTARLWFGGAITLFLAAAGGVGFLVWRSFRGPAHA